MTRIAVLQMTSGVDPEANFETIFRAVCDARAGGAEMLFTPEMSLLLDRDRKRAAPHIVPQSVTPFPDRLRKAAKSKAMWMTAGIPVALESGRYANRQWLFSPSGELTSHYDKIHMFDVELSTGESWRESSAYEPGTEVVTIDETPVGRLGLTTCYDMRFPALFEALGRRKCNAISIPAAFTVPTGKAHWHVMLRARAIEASAFVIAAAQVGKHEDGRETYGHSLVVDPWGEVLLDMGGEEPGLAFVDLDMARIEEVRSQLPSLANKRDIPS
ncbi:carbon-nitrogen hydrolase family protein [Altererythrobacter lutimaris]|uniref:Carbon-nitrogen hydrolase family protein n=1 Tax=Altererythrobacter lutimaris TaxID=2743979 RepID=A0A850HAR3_9SPHN|nr:carbon-nitrogen hydrolase family protein [Altererythrobacter lutimaris]NVE93986.1 carbon-nitrogen hydrolase family protein [Altererythrobacter lutimaris]